LIRTPVLLWTLFLALSEFACNSGGKTNSSGHSIEPKLSSIQQEIFDESCSAPSCHGSGKKGNLSLVAGNAFAQLVDVRSTVDKKNAPPFLRVKPGSPDSSLLFVKIIAPDTNQGEVMPKGTDKLTQNSIDAIRRWILNGAPNN
jgi:mono/diheme cytochrome c family protein